MAVPRSSDYKQCIEKISCRLCANQDRSSVGNGEVFDDANEDNTVVVCGAPTQDFVRQIECSGWLADLPESSTDGSHSRPADPVLFWQPCQNPAIKERIHFFSFLFVNLLFAALAYLLIVAKKRRYATDQQLRINTLRKTPHGGSNAQRSQRPPPKPSPTTVSTAASPVALLPPKKNVPAFPRKQDYVKLSGSPDRQE